MAEPAEKFDARAAWAALGAADRDAIGAAAVLLGYSTAAGLVTGWRDAIAFAAAEYAGLALLDDALAQAGIVRGAQLARPDLAVFGIRACRRCGGTGDRVLGPWVAPDIDLCTVCAREIAAEDRAGECPGD